MKKILIIFNVLFLSFILSAQSVAEKKTSETQTIVSLSPNITETIFALDRGSELIGRTNVCDYPLEVLEIDDVGDMYSPSVEKIISLNPSVVIATNLTSLDTINTLRNAGYNVEVLVYQESLDGTYDFIEKIGQIINAEEKANAVISEMKDKIKEVTNIVSNLSYEERKSCIYMISWGEFGDWCATGDTYLGEILEVAGGINAAKDCSNWVISKETLLKSNPDIIFLSYYTYMSNGPENFKQTEPYNVLTGKIIQIDGQRAERQGVRTAETVAEIAKALYPDLF